MASASMGASLDLRKMLIYPVPRGSLFLVEILLRIATCAELLLVLAGAAIGLLRNPAFGGWGAPARVPLAVVFFAAFNLMLAAGLRNLIERLLSRKGMREVLALLLMMLGVLPRLLMVTGVASKRLEHVFPAASNALWPWGAAAQLACWGFRRRRAARHGGGSYAGRMDGGGLLVRALAICAQLAVRLSGGAGDCGAGQRPGIRGAALQAAGAGAARSAVRHGGEGTAHAGAHAALPAGLRDGVLVRAGGVAADDAARTGGAFRGIRQFSDGE